MMQYKAICLVICSFLFFNKTAMSLEICGTLKQGGLVKISDTNLQKIVINGDEFEAEDDVALVAFGRDASTFENLKIFYNDGSMDTKKIKISPVNWKVQKINGILPKKLMPSGADTKEIQREQSAVNSALNATVSADGWKQIFIKPVEGRSSGEFGVQRIMNGIKKSPHQGWDIATSEGTKVKATADGVVTLSEGEFFYSGNMVIINHGKNLSSIYSHLQKNLVEDGENVKQGQVIGLVGDTGRATGAHLHFGASVGNIRFDTHNLLDLADAKCVDL